MSNSPWTPKGKKKAWWENEDEYYAGEFDSTEDVLRFGSAEHDWGGSYNYGFGQSLFSKKDQNERGQFSTTWDEYKKTGVWRGYDYFSTPQLDYRYIEQMANAFAAKYRIDVQIGNFWAVDIPNKKLTYDPSTLTSGTKANLIASLLHEIGHLRHTTYYDDLPAVAPDLFHKYPKAAREVLNIFEDFRIDELMSKSYSGAEDIFEANKPIVKKVAEAYRIKAETIKGHFKAKLEEIEEKIFEIQKHPDKEKIIQESFGGKEKFEAAKQEMRSLREQALSDDNLFNYCRLILLRGYGEKIEAPFDEKILARITKTESAIFPATKAATTTDVLKLLEEKVYPVIEDLMKENETQMEQLAQAIGGQQMVNEIAALFAQLGMGGARTVNGNQVYDKNGNPVTGNEIPSRAEQASMASGHSENYIPPEWASGDYNVLRDSVRGAVNQLVRKLMFIRRAELVPRWSSAKTRGRLDPKRLYRHKLESRRLFRQKEEVKDTISSFAFSISVDISGSMSGERMIHTTRGLVLFAEVFAKMDIPFELTVFNNDVKFIKSFDDPLSEEKKRKIGGLVKAATGGTNMHRIFDKERGIKIERRGEKNKILLILSDGGVGYGYDYNSEFMRLQRKGVKTMGISLACGDEIVKLCLNQGIVVDTAQQLPMDFAALLKSLIKKR